MDTTKVIIYSFALFASLHGWGQLVIFGLRHKKNFEVIAPLAGLCVFLVLGGALKITGWVNETSFLILLAMGLVLFLFSIRNSLPLQISTISIKKWRLHPLIFLYLVSTPFLLSGLMPAEFNTADDFRGYLLALLKLIQVGQAKLDPFNARVVTGGPNSLMYLQAMSASVLDIYYVSIVDRFLGILLLANSFYFLHKSFQIRSRYLLALLFFIFLVETLNLAVNITPLYITIAFFCALIVILFRWKGLTDYKLSLLLGMIAGTLMTLKNTFVVPVLFFSFMNFFWAISLHKEKRNIILRNSLMAAGISASTVFLWFYDHLTISIVHMQRLEILEVVTYIFKYATKNHYFTSALILNGILVCLCLRQRKQAFPVEIIVLFFATIVSIVMTVLLSQAISIHRYCYPIVLVSTAYLAAFCWSGAEREKWKISAPLIIVIAGLVMNGLYQPKREFLLGLINRVSKFNLIKQNITDFRIDQDREMAMLRDAQRHLEERGTLLAYISKPYLLDFKRNDISVLDIPGLVSPYPGMKCNDSFEAISAFLHSTGIRYILTSKDFLQEREEHTESIKEEWKARHTQPMNLFRVNNMYNASVGFHHFLRIGLEKYRIVYAKNDLVLLELPQ